MDLPPHVPEEASARFEQAYSAQMNGRLDEAADLYQQSLSICPTAEAHTFLGWVYSMQRRYDDAIAECHRAIEVDPDFGNPYNDIGVYLMQQDRLDEAIPWLEKAKRAPRYEPRQFPFMNMGRIYVKQGKTWDALHELEAAVRLAPTDKSAHRMRHEIRAKLN